ncbi:MAG: hypothetical protein KA731_01995 [Candidatus Moranbacteria bacterium]|nr:hypothetical protein [Candidatus Moranbacteria bacterium]MBP7696023.1 hypothetical protein [Candidatus Moranbacteria bacterium]
MESLDFTGAIQEHPKTPAELAEILRKQGEEFRQTQAAATELDFTAHEAALKDARQAAELLEKIKSMPDDRIVPDEDDPYSKFGDQANRRGIH